jgi:hypothetical protein
VPDVPSVVSAAEPGAFSGAAVSVSAVTHEDWPPQSLITLHASGFSPSDSEPLSHHAFWPPSTGGVLWPEASWARLSVGNPGDKSEVGVGPVLLAKLLHVLLSRWPQAVLRVCWSESVNASRPWRLSAKALPWLSCITLGPASDGGAANGTGSWGSWHS